MSFVKTKLFKNFTPLWPFVKPYKKYMWGLGVVVMLGAAAVLVVGFSLRHFIDYGIEAENIGKLELALALLLLFALCLVVSSSLRVRLITHIGENVMRDLRKRVFQHVIGQKQVYFNQFSLNDIHSRLMNDCQLLTNMLGSSGSMALRNVFLVIGGSIFLMFTSAKLTLMVLLLIPVIIVPIILFAKKAQKTSCEEQNRLSELHTFFEEHLTGVTTIQSYGLETYTIQKLDDVLSQHHRAILKRVAAKTWLTTALIMGVMLAVIVLLWVGGRGIISEKLSSGEFTAFTFYALVVAASIGGISDLLANMHRAEAALTRIFDLFQITQPGLVKENIHKTIGVAFSPDHLFEGSIIFNRVSFAYPTRAEKAVLQDISLHVQPKEKVAIVGPSGAGKSTIFALISQFFTEYTGDILIDGYSLSTFPRGYLQQHIGLVPQEPVIFSTSVYQNVIIGKPEASIEEVETAITRAGLLEVVQAMPHGLDTYVGEKGYQLSGGQKQRLSLARLILKNPTIVMLDEATNALDSSTEEWVQNALHDWCEDKTVLTIAHRLATVRNADQIFVLDQGKVIANGKHDVLLKICPLYKKLAALQFLDESTQKSA